jgi:hypothetical protein
MGDVRFGEDDNPMEIPMGKEARNVFILLQSKALLTCPGET